jgi:hypothetical protein
MMSFGEVLGFAGAAVAGRSMVSVMYLSPLGFVRTRL